MPELRLGGDRRISGSLRPARATKRNPALKKKKKEKKQKQKLKPEGAGDGLQVKNIIMF